MKCNVCGRIVRSKAKFCTHCGAEIKHTVQQQSQPRKRFQVESRRCEKCGKLVEPSKKFCTACGKPLTSKTWIAKPVLSTHPAINCGIQAKRKMKIALVLIIFMVGIFCAWIFLQSGNTPDKETKKITEGFGIDWEPPSFPVLAEASQLITSADGGIVELENGARVEIPPGAIQTDTRITLQKLEVSGPEGRSSDIYEIGPDDIKLLSPVTIAFPIDPNSLNIQLPKELRGVASESPSIAYLTKKGTLEEIPAQVDIQKSEVIAQTNHFSTWLTENYPSQWWEEIERNLKKGSVLLDVPYYPQGDSRWCWAAGIQMLAKYFGKDQETWDIANGSQFGAALKDGSNGLLFMHGIYASALRSFLGNPALKVEWTSFGWWRGESVLGYIIYNLSRERPVYLAIPSAEHVVVAVGYNKDGIFIHDPSGQLKVSLGSLVNDKNLGPCFFSWSEWKRLWQSLTGLVKSWHTMVVVHNPSADSADLVGWSIPSDPDKEPSPAKEPSVTMTVLHGDLKVQPPSYIGLSNTYDNTFSWDGTKELYGYEFILKTPTMFKGLEFNGFCKSSLLTRFIATLANSTREEQRVILRVYLKKLEADTILPNGKPLFQKTLRLPAWTTNTEVDLTSQIPKDIFSLSSLVPGNYRFELDLEVDGFHIDRTRIVFQLGPSKPTGLTAKWRDDDLILSWNRNPESNVDYGVWKNHEMIIDRTSNTSTTDTMASKYTQDIYSVEAFIMDNDQINSLASDPVKSPKHPGSASAAVKTSSIEFDVIRIENKSSGNDLIVDYDGWIKGNREYGHANLHVDIIYKANFEHMDVRWIAPDGQEFAGNNYEKRGSYDCISTSISALAQGLWRLCVYAQVDASYVLVHEETFQVNVVSGPRMIGPS